MQVLLIFALSIHTARLTSAAGPTLSLQVCEVGFAPELLAVQPDGSVAGQHGLCVSAITGGLTMEACDGTATQQFTFRADGTVQSVGTPSLCWNANGGSSQPGTLVFLYQCGVASDTAAAANDIFTPLSAEGHIFANESKLCVSSAAAPPSPCVGPACCQLNGELDVGSGNCVCYSPWTGANCSVLDILPSSPINGYGMAPNLTAWGGNIIFDAQESIYHLYVAEMELGCPLNTWGQNSACAHATAVTPNGPFVRQGLAVENWCHNPQMIVSTQSGAPYYVLFHIGSGSGGSMKNCTAVAAADGDAGGPIHVATSPYGPFTAVNPVGFPGCNNPAPFLHPNGTFFVVCNGFDLYRSDAVLGPWSHVTSISCCTGGIAASYEDPLLWIDPRGFWHLIYHIYTTNVPDSCVGSLVSAHGYSPDGFSWSWSAVQPYGNLVTFTDNTTLLVSTRERPKFLFDANGNPTHLTNGVCGGSSFCAPTPCVNSQRGVLTGKYDFWDFNLVAPLRIST